MTADQTQLLFNLQSLSWLLANISSFPHYIMPHLIFPHRPLIRSITPAALQGYAFSSACLWQDSTWTSKNTSSIFHEVSGFKWRHKVWLGLQMKQNTKLEQKGAPRLNPHTRIHFSQNQVPPSSLLHLFGYLPKCRSVSRGRNLRNIIWNHNTLNINVLCKEVYHIYYLVSPYWFDYSVAGTI